MRSPKSGFQLTERVADHGSLVTIGLAGVGLVAAAGALEAARRLFRDSQLFCPAAEPLTSWDPPDYGLDAGVEEVTIRTSDGETLHGWYCRAERPVGSMLYCHGNTGNITSFTTGLPHLLAGGFNVLIFDYRGYGRSTGRPSVRGVVLDAVAAAEYHDRIRPANLPSIAYGYSLGGAVAAQLVRVHPFDAVVLESTFTNLPDIAKTCFPALPLHLVAGGDFDTLEIISHLSVPLLVIHGSCDETVPVTMGERIFAASPAGFRFERIDGGLHKNLYEVDAERIVRSIRDLAASLPGYHEPAA